MGQPHGGLRENPPVGHCPRSLISYPLWCCNRIHFPCQVQSDLRPYLQLPEVHGLVAWRTRAAVSSALTPRNRTSQGVLPEGCRTKVEWDEEVRVIRDPSEWRSTLNRGQLSRRTWGAGPHGGFATEPTKGLTPPIRQSRVLQVRPLHDDAAWLYFAAQ